MAAKNTKPVSVVTGGAGFLGSHLTDRLLAEGHRVICVDNLDTGSLSNIEHIRVDAFAFVNHDVIAHIDIPEAVDYVFCTHFHLDHVAGLAYLPAIGMCDQTTIWGPGRLLYDAQNYLELAPYWATFPGFLIFLAVISINFIGDGIRDALDPRKIQ